MNIRSSSLSPYLAWCEVSAFSPLDPFPEIFSYSRLGCKPESSVALTRTGTTFSWLVDGFGVESCLGGADFDGIGMPGVDFEVCVSLNVEEVALNGWCC